MHKLKNVDIDGSKFDFLTKDDLKNADYYLNNIVVNGKVYNMMPSTIGTIVMLKNLL